MIVFSQDSSKGLEVFVDADFAGIWDPDIYNQICWMPCLLAEQTLNGDISFYRASEIHCNSQALRETIPLHSLMT